MTRLRSLRFYAALLFLIIASGSAGCKRAYYREQADQDAYSLIREKAVYPHWPLERHWIDVDPRSRMFDPFNPDRPPMPPDDPASHELMHYVDDKEGYPHWHANGETPFVENPTWMANLHLDENGVLNLDAEQSYQLALIHSPNYQQEFETLYLSALDVTTERFRFDTQFFGGYSAFYTTSGRLRTPRSELELSTFTQQTGRLGLPAGGVTAPTSADILMRKSFATGADLAVGFANSLVWEFAGPDEHSAFTILDLSLIQPLLRAAGRDRILEQLTIAERALLGNVRQMERFRRAFYVEIITGADAGQGATRRGGLFGASGLSGFTGVGGGGFGGIGGFGGAGGFGGGGGGGFGGGGAGAASVQGFLGLLQQLQDIRNQQITIVGLRSNLAQLRESLRESLLLIPEDVETIVRERLQIAQARQALLNAESRLLNSQAAFQATLDGFKFTLGLPPELCVNIQDPMVDQFNLIDPDTLEVQSELTDLRETVAAVNDLLLSSAGTPVAPDDMPREVPWNPRLVARITQLRSNLVRMQTVLQRVQRDNVARTLEDIERLRQAIPERRRELSGLQEKYDQELERFRRYNNLDPCQDTLLADIDPAVYDVERLEAAPGELEEEIAQLQDQFGQYTQPLGEIIDYLDQLLATRDTGEGIDFDALERRVVFAVPSLLSDLSDDVLDLSLIQARARADTVDLVPIDLDWEIAVELARQYRRDWMNQRAGLVDTWRLIEFNADNLESTLDLVFQGDLQNVGDNPLRLRDINGQMRVGLRFDAPLTRLQERNTYRQALIEYQQARRTYYRFVDNVTRTLRNTVRSIDLNRINFEERRLAVLSAIDQVVLNDQIQKLREERGLEAGVTAARDVVSALADLQSAQNDFLAVWLNYEAQRLSLDLDLGTMNLDPLGNWIDPGPIGPEVGYPVPLGCSGEVDLILGPEAGLEGEELPRPPVPSDGVLPPPPAARMEPAGGRIIQSAFLDSVLGPPATASPVNYEGETTQRLPEVDAPPFRRLPVTTQR